ncbi:hypothetical protein MCAL160_0861 [Mycoplasmopsis californica HAZ160_1]|uniref:ECF transporter S component n=2 Tax=Mycoplasmopsis californica TaxID=2113 RepID=A0AAT9F933_9BACT|nr:hypothetical protein MCAL160_0861 [Mycoplasmopsis californica HAZ160_1]BBG42870.1 hypothetical protein MCAL160E_0861 [Mycoplasmopsis californica]BBG43445.1 hypothetical protein MCAL160L_0861 [Mycoplasmopsis californica]
MLCAYNYFNSEVTMNETQIEKKSFFNINLKKLFKFTVFEIVLSAILLAAHIIVIMFAKFTILRIIPIGLENILYIFYGIILGPFKGALLAILGDTIPMLLTGSIGQWFWLYAITPPLIAIVSWVYSVVFKSNKIVAITVSTLLTFVSLAIVFYVYFKYSETDGTFKINSSKKNPIFAPKNLIIWMIALYIFLSLAVSGLCIKLYSATKNDKWLNYLMIMSLVIIISIVFRWIIGPIQYIEYYNYFKAPNSKAGLKYYSLEYILLFTKIVIKDLFVIPIYIIVLTPIYNAVYLLNNKHKSEQNTRYL